MLPRTFPARPDSALRPAPRVWVILRAVEQHLIEILAWLEPRALILALALPPVIRVVGHLIPEELFMIAVGVLAARAGSPMDAVVLLLAVTVSHAVADHATYAVGRLLRPHLFRFPRISKRISGITDRLTSSPMALLGLVLGRVFPIGRGAWLISAGVVGLSWPLFLAVNLLALVAHLATWSGLGWWLSGDLHRLAQSAEAGTVAATWVAACLFGLLLASLLWKRRAAWHPATVAVLRRAGDSLRGSRDER